MFATTTKNPKIRICKINPPRMMFSPMLNPLSSLARMSIPAPPPWMKLGLNISILFNSSLQTVYLQTENIAANKYLRNPLWSYNTTISRVGTQNKTAKDHVDRSREQNWGEDDKHGLDDVGIFVFCVVMRCSSANIANSLKDGAYHERNVEPGPVLDETEDVNPKEREEDDGCDNCSNEGWIVRPKHIFWRRRCVWHDEMKSKFLNDKQKLVVLSSCSSSNVFKW